MPNEAGLKRDWWRSFWVEFPTAFGEDDFFRQVGHTIRGEPYTDVEFQAILESIASRLELSGDDSLLDLCCGNGLITSKLAAICNEVVAVDFSPSLLKVATKHQSTPNLTYRCADALNLAQANLRPTSFSKVLLYAALQHFQREDLEPLLRSISELATDNAIVLFGGVLDIDRKSNFLDTPKKRRRYEQYCAAGKDRLGTWWDAHYISDICDTVGLTCDVHREEDGRPGDTYRFDAVIRRRRTSNKSKTFRN